jgi:hypothetical protein
MSQHFNIQHIITDFVTDFLQSAYTNELKYEKIYQEICINLQVADSAEIYFVCLCVYLSHAHTHAQT